MDIEISEFNLPTVVFVPASKSYLQRYIALASLCIDESVLKNPNYCNDVLAALNVAKSMGAEVFLLQDEIKIRGIDMFKEYESIEINVGESGLSARMFGLIASGLFKEVTVMGSGSILNRSMQSLINVLKMAGCMVKSDNNCLPLWISGLADYQDILIKDSDTSQIITGLMYASVLMNRDVLISIENPVSIPYIDISMDVARKAGIDIEYSGNYKQFKVKKCSAIKPFNVLVEGDWSNAAFFAVSAALNGKVKLMNLNKYSFQGDKFILDILQDAGVKIYWEDSACVIEKKLLHPFEVDLNHYPDLFPPLVVLALGINGTSVLRGVSRLFNKESNRAEVLVKEFIKLGADIEIKNDEMIVRGKSYLNGGAVYSHNDHRIVMAAAIASIIARDTIEIKNADAVKKSYPFFFRDLLGMN